MGQGPPRRLPFCRKLLYNALGVLLGTSIGVALPLCVHLRSSRHLVRVGKCGTGAARPSQLDISAHVSCVVYGSDPLALGFS